MAAYKRHRKRGEPPCGACAEACRVDFRRRYAATGAGKWPADRIRRSTEAGIDGMVLLERLGQVDGTLS